MSAPIGAAIGRPGNLLGTVGAGPASPSAAAAQAGSAQAPLALTLPAPPRAGASPAGADRVRAAASGPARASSTPSRAQVAQDRLSAAQAKLLEARQAGVDVARSSFWKKALGTALAGVALGVAAGLTALSFGGAAPLLALACVNFAVSGGDAICAWRNLRNTQAAAEQRPPPYAPLPLGNSIVGNVLHGLLTRCNVSAGTAASAALWGSRAAGLGLGVASFAVGAGLSGLPLAYELAGKLASGIGTAAAALSTLTGAMTNDLDRELLQGSVDDIRRDVSALREPLQGESALDAQGRALAADILQSLDGPQSPQQLHEAALADNGRVRDAVVGTVGVLRATEPALGLVNLLVRA